MIGRGIFTGLLVLALTGCGNGYSHIVDKPQADVVAALEDLDITQQPGNPGTDPSASGGVKPEIRLEKAADHMTWWVMSGDKVAITMTANFEPLDGGARTRVTTSVVRGDAPDERVSPAFQSTGIASGLFSVAVDEELDKMTAPPAASAKTCNALMERFRDENLANPDLQGRPDGFAQGISQGVKAMARLRQMQAEARARGCSIYGSGKFTEVKEEMRPADDGTPIDVPRPRETDTADTSGDGIPDN
ncbi:MAG: hypothetical protein E7773_08205 [Sphingomonas sp.]|uniref:hypothetical protein n=1 Tax=Sphingomonas sp. TaxID=28214 RepID=UPI00121984F6|nr:hypothetical protein [Sphingomonas sp.]THD35922.1 MAG: hypothetical protein E7773_08205 [Sphingomonas sp.]